MVNPDRKDVKPGERREDEKRGDAPGPRDNEKKGPEARGEALVGRRDEMPHPPEKRGGSFVGRRDEKQRGPEREPERRGPPDPKAEKIAPAPVNEALDADVPSQAPSREEPAAEEPSATEKAGPLTCCGETFKSRELYDAHRASVHASEQTEQTPIDA